MKITSGIVKQPHFVALYGIPGIGKSTFGSEAPKPIFLDIEKGSKHLAVSRDESIGSFQELQAAIQWLLNEKHDYQTAVIDTLDAIEPMLFDYVTKLDPKATNIEEVGGGFQKGYVFAMTHWNNLINSLQDLRSKRKMNVIAIAHSKVVTVNDPSQALPYDRFTMKLHENKQVSASALWREKVDALLFAAYEDTIFKVNAKDKKGKATGEGVRKLYATRTAAWDAKNRLGLPSELPFSLGSMWSSFANAAELGQPDSIENIKKDLSELQEELQKRNDGTAAKMGAAIIKSGDDLNKLIGIRNHARILVEGK